MRCALHAAGPIVTAVKPHAALSILVQHLALEASPYHSSIEGSPIDSGRVVNSLIPSSLNIREMRSERKMIDRQRLNQRVLRRIPGVLA